MVPLVGLIIAGLALAIWLDIQLGRRQTRRAEMLLAEGGVAFEAGDLDRAERLWKKAASCAAWVRGGPLFFLAHYNWANALARLGRYGSAEKAARRALRSIGSLPDSVELGLKGSYPEVRHCLALFAESLVKQSKFPEAIAYYEAVVKLWQEAEGEDGLYTGYYSQELGLACARMGLFQQGLDHLSKAADVARKRFGVTHPALATALLHYGDALIKCGRGVEAELAISEALQIRQSIAGPCHPSVAAAQASLGNLHLERGDYEDAADCFGKALVTFEAELGANHPDVAALRARLADTRRRQGQLGESEQLANMALFVLGESKDPAYSDALETMAQVRSDQGNLKDAAELYRESRLWMEQAPASDLSRRARLLHNEARLRRRIGEENKADELASLALAIRQAIRSAPTPSGVIEAIRQNPDQ